jgi:hypothetical protein
MTTQFEETKFGLSKEMPAKKVIYGVPKIGKSRFCADAPDPFYINIEGGLDYIGKEVRSTPKLSTFDDVIGWLKHIYDTDTFTCGTIVVDSLDWAEKLAQAKISKNHGGASLNDASVKAFAYNKGYEMAGEEAIKILAWLDAIYKKKGIKCILIAHSQIKNMDLPDKDPYSRYELKLHKGLAARVAEWADLILFANYSFAVSKDGKVSEPKPVFMAGGSASFVGGGRMLLTKEIPLDYKQLEQQITKGK